MSTWLVAELASGLAPTFGETEHRFGVVAPSGEIVAYAHFRRDAEDLARAAKGATEAERAARELAAREVAAAEGLRVRVATLEAQIVDAGASRLSVADLERRVDATQAALERALKDSERRAGWWRSRAIGLSRRARARRRPR